LPQDAVAIQPLHLFKVSSLTYTAATVVSYNPNRRAETPPLVSEYQYLSADPDIEVDAAWQSAQSPRLQVSVLLLLWGYGIIS